MKSLGGVFARSPPWRRPWFQTLFSLNLQKYIILGGRKGAALLFIREWVFEEIINAKFKSLFCQKLYIHKILGIARGQNPSPKKILYLVS